MCLSLAKITQKPFFKVCFIDTSWLQTRSLVVKVHYYPDYWVSIGIDSSELAYKEAIRSKYFKYNCWHVMFTNFNLKRKYTIL